MSRPPAPGPALGTLGTATAVLTLAVWAAGAGLTVTAPAARAQGPVATLAAARDAVVIEAREAYRKRDLARLQALRRQAIDAEHPLAAWVDYWDLNARLAQATAGEMAGFFARWPDSYLEDRLRNDWLLELGRRRDWPAVRTEFPRFRMNDDREVSCYVLMADHAAGRPVRDEALQAWLAQRDTDAGCHLLASTLFDAGVFGADEVWLKLRLAVEQGRMRSARAAAGLLGPRTMATLTDLWDQPEKFLARDKASTVDATTSLTGLTAVAVARLADKDPDAAARRLEDGPKLPAAWAGWAWAQVGRQAAIKQQPQAVRHFERSFALMPRGRSALPLADDTLAWLVRAQLRAGTPAWGAVVRAIDAMSGAERANPTWVYWRARADLAMAPPGAEGEAARLQARAALAAIAGQMNFYGKLAAEDLERPLALPAAPAPPSTAERDAARAHAGLSRALQMIDIGLRSEGVREWNYSLRGMADRELLAAAQRACEREVWDRCIHTSERTRDEVDMTQRFPMPFRQAVLAQSRSIGLDPAYVYGLIRQESRFVVNAQSHVGASGLMQLMPATARWTARKVGLPYTPEMITERDVNLKLGTAYLKLVLDDFGGSQAMAAAAYNAGPGRPRRWREGAVVEPAAWAENIPLSETRDYVKKVLSNAAYYAALIHGTPPELKSRLGPPIGPRDGGAGAVNRELP